MAITQAILPVAGLGTRFLPWTKVVPKELLPLGNRPIIAHLVDECIDAGITDICFVISHGKELIPQYFYESPELEEELKRRGKEEALAALKRYDAVDFHVVYQDEQHGDGHAVLQARDWVNTETIAVLFGDDLFTGDASGTAQLAAAHEALPERERGVLLALEDIPREKTPLYGIVDTEGAHPTIERAQTVKGLVEKPQPEDAPSTLGIVGRYLIPASTFDVLQRLVGDHANEIRLVDAFLKQLGSTPIIGLQCKGTRIDTGTPEGYREAVNVLSS